MKKLVRIFFFGIFCLTLICCMNEQNLVKQQEQVSKNEITNQYFAKTFVNTGVSENGKVYTVYQFDQILDVVAIDKVSGEQKNISQYLYNKNTTEISMLEVDNQVVYHIEGLCKGRDFTLNCINSEPLVIYKGEILQKVDYQYNTKTHILTLNVPLDLNNDSYGIFWLTHSGENMFGNNLIIDDKFNQMIADWIVSQKG